MYDIYNKDWVNHLIIGAGVLVGIFIIFGFISNIRDLRRLSQGPREVVSNCEYCLNSTDNNTQSTVELGTEFMLELPAATYSKDDLVLIENPTGALRKQGFVTSNVPGMWRLQLKAVSKGISELLIKSSDPATQDFHAVFIIE
jgi:hypothetical protein